MIAVQMDRWLGEYRPRVESLLATLKAFDADSPALAELPARLDATDAAQAELWAIHFRIVVGMLLSMQGFGEFYAELFQAPEQEAYELREEGWRATPSFDAFGVGYGDRGPAASAVLCSELSVGRLRRLLTPDGLARTLRRRTRPVRHRH